MCALKQIGNKPRESTSVTLVVLVPSDYPFEFCPPNAKPNGKPDLERQLEEQPRDDAV